MNKIISSPQNRNPLSESSSCTLYVCTSCRIAGTSREPYESRQGFRLYRKLKELVEDGSLQDQVVVKPAQCLSVCPRPCGIALASPESWTYIFGDQKSEGTEQDILECVSLYLKVQNGFMVRSTRPKSLQSSILGRVPPIEGENHAPS